MWAHFFGRGMNELPAADDFGGHNKVVHPDLLNRLAEEFVKYGYDTEEADRVDLQLGRLQPDATRPTGCRTARAATPRTRRPRTSPAWR